jgi:hypothetical protein
VTEKGKGNRLEELKRSITTTYIEGRVTDERNSKTETGSSLYTIVSPPVMGYRAHTG